MGQAFFVLGFMMVLMANASMNVNVKQPNAHMYHQQNSRNDEFNYGYHVDTVSNQFQHKVKGPDDVTYGCYGYVDPSNRKHLVYYVADRMGYRIIFPNRQTKIFTARVSDSLNKLDGALKTKDYDEKVVAWNDLYLPDSCFRLGEILSTAASTVTQHVAQPEHSHSTVTRVETSRPSQPQQVFLNPTQYTVPSQTPRTSTLGVINTVQTEPRDGRYTQPVIPSYVPHGQVQNNVHNSGQDNYNPEPDNNLNSEDQNTEPTVSVWPGTLPDINPANINLDQFDIHNRFVGTAGTGSSTQFTPQQYGLNITQLLAQIEAVNSQVITLNMLLAGMANNPATFSSANEGSCKTVVQLLQSQKTTPQLVYVPILIPYVEGQHNINEPFGAPVKRYQQRQV